MTSLRAPCGVMIAIGLLWCRLPAFGVEAEHSTAQRVPNWIPIPGALHERAAPPLPILEGSFDLASDVPGIPLVSCTYIIPMGPKDTPAPTAPDMVVRFGWIGQNALSPGENTRDLAIKYGFTVLTIQWPQQNVSLDDKSAFSLYPTSGSGSTWVRAINCVRQIGCLPDRKVFCIGYSAGGSASHQFSEWKPSLVEAYVSIGGRTFSDSPSFPGPALLMHSERDRSSENDALVQALRANAFPALRVTYPPDWTGRGVREGWAHNGDGAAWDFAFKWLSAIADQRAKNGKVLPYGQWPVVGGIKVPDKRSGEALAIVTRPPRVELADGQTTVFGGMRITGSPIASIAWLDFRFPSDEDELMAAVEMLTAKNYLCGAAIVDRDMPSSIATKALLKGMKTSSCNTLVMVQPRNDNLVSLSEIGIRPTWLVLIRPVEAPTLTAIASLRSMGSKIYVLSSLQTNENAPFQSAKCEVTTWRPVQHSGARYVEEINFVDHVMAKDR